MKKIPSLFTFVGLIAVITVTGALFFNASHRNDNVTHVDTPTTRYGAFLAAQHAMYVNDFARAVDFANVLHDVDYSVVNNTKLLSDFLTGHLPVGADALKNEKTLPMQLIYDAYLVQNERWDELYKRHRGDESALSAPLRIWASAAVDRRTEVLKFIDTLNTNDSWKSFARGQVYTAANMTDAAAAEFANVRPDFMNINDYMYIMSFYAHNNMDAAATRLRDAYTSFAGGVFMSQYDNIPDWSQFAGFQNQLAFSLIQNVSHTNVMMYSDLAILLLSFAEITGPTFGPDNATTNYYKGLYFFNNSGDFASYFNKIERNSPYYLFAGLRMAEKDKSAIKLQQILEQNPLFTPAVARMIAYNVQHGDKRAALRTVNTAIDNPNLSDAARAFFIKGRAQINYTFGDFDAAQSDLHAAADVLAMDADILSLQAKIWAAQNREIENAYDYAMALVKQNPTDIVAWDTLGAVVAIREGPAAALEILARVGTVATTCSALFERMGDLYVKTGEKRLARDAYMRAIELSDDGLTILPELNKKLRNVK